MWRKSRSPRFKKDRGIEPLDGKPTVLGIWVDLQSTVADPLALCDVDQVVKLGAISRA
jgi:hypothetical protein